MRDNKNVSGKKSNMSWWVKLLAGGSLSAVIALGVSGFINNSPSEPDVNNDSVFDEYISDAPGLDPNAGKYVESKEDETVSRGISIPGWDTLNIPKDQTEVKVDFYNPEENKEMYYLTFELRLPDKSEQGYEVLYKSGLVNPGLHIQNITLSHKLDLGVYDAIIHVQPYCMDEQKTATNNADMQTQLVVS